MTDLWPKARISQSMVLELIPTGWALTDRDGSSLGLTFDEAEAVARIVLNLARMRSQVGIAQEDEMGSGEGPRGFPPLAVAQQIPMNQTVAQRVAMEIRRDILSGRYQPGDRLEENGLAKRHGVSRTPVREALNQLASAGLVQYEPRKGCRVAAARAA